MNAVDRARLAYSSRTQPVRAARDIEYEAFARVTHRLRSAAATESTARLFEALHENRRLWIALAGDVAEEGNGLPAPLRARIFYLNEFTRQHSSKVLKGEATAEILVDINTAMMRGLRREAGGGS